MNFSIAARTALLLSLGSAHAIDNVDYAPSAARSLHKKGSFNRVATWFVCSQLDPTCNVDDETSAETIWVTKDSNTLVYTDSPGERVGFIDISDASAPKAMGFVDLPGEPTTVKIHGNYGKCLRQIDPSKAAGMT